MMILALHSLVSTRFGVGGWRSSNVSITFWTNARPIAADCGHHNTVKLACFCATTSMCGHTNASQLPVLWLIRTLADTWKNQNDWICLYSNYPDCSGSLDMVPVDTADWVSNQYSKSATRPMHSNEQIVTDGYRIGMDDRTVTYDKVQCSSMPFYAPFSISCGDSETRSWFDARWDTGHGRFRCAVVGSGNGWNEIPSLIPMSDSGCTRFVAVLFHRLHSLYLEETREKKETHRNENVVLGKFIKIFGGNMIKECEKFDLLL